MNQELRIKIAGKVIKGEQIGRKLGFPTANLERRGYSRLKKKPKFGVYAGEVGLPSGKKYRAGIVLGPADKRGLPKIEVYLIGFRGNLYNTYLNAYLNKYIRPFKKFEDVKKLKRQIKKDVKSIKKMIKMNKNDGN